MEAIIDLASWGKENSALWIEPYLITLFPTIMALVADKQRPVQLKADEAGAALMAGLSEHAVDGMLPLLFKQFEEHRWQTKLGAVNMFKALAASSTKAVTQTLVAIVVKLMECCSVIDNADVAPLIDTVISANMNP